MEELWYHVDVNSAFLSWSAAHEIWIKGGDLDLRTVPSVIGGNEKDRRGIVLAKSGPAARFGIRTGETLVEARNKCPGLIIAPPEYDPVSYTHLCMSMPPPGSRTAMSSDLALKSASAPRSFTPGAPWA